MAARWPGSPPATDPELDPADTPVALSIKEFAVVRAIVDAFFPAEDGFPSGVEVGIHQRIDEELWAAPDRLRGDIKSGLQLIEHLPPIYGHPHRFTALSREARVAVFTSMTRSSRETIRQIAVALKQMSQIFYYGHEKVWPMIHYDGTFVKTPKPPPSSIAYASLVKSRRGA
ncbi:MAG: hypothetical protein QM820_13070 [Minicystis sp.]